MRGHTRCRVTVNMVGAPLGSEVNVKHGSEWAEPLINAGFLVPLEHWPSSSPPKPLEDTEPTIEAPAPPDPPDALSEPTDAAEAPS